MHHALLIQTARCLRSTVAAQGHHDTSALPTNGSNLSPQELWAGVAISRESDHSIQLGIAIHDGTYSMDFAVHRISLPDGADEDERAACIENHVLSELSEYRTQHLCKLLGVGVSVELDQAGPRLCSRLWSELDIVPVVFESTPLMFKDKGRNLADVDELADTLARKCIR